MTSLLTRKPLLAAAVGLGVAFAAGYAIAAQPHMQAALNALQTAKTELQQAEANKAGHRENAIKLVNEAIAETQAGIDAAK